MGNRPVISKDQILGAAYEIATTQGLGALSIRAVATACGVAAGSFRLHGHGQWGRGGGKR